MSEERKPMVFLRISQVHGTDIDGNYTEDLANPKDLIEKSAYDELRLALSKVIEAHEGLRVIEGQGMDKLYDAIEEARLHVG